MVASFRYRYSWISSYMFAYDLLSLGFCALHVAFLSMLSHTLCVSECIDIYGI